MPGLGSTDPAGQVLDPGIVALAGSDRPLDLEAPIGPRIAAPNPPLGLPTIWTCG